MLWHGYGEDASVHPAGAQINVPKQFINSATMAEGRTSGKKLRFFIREDVREGVKPSAMQVS